MCGCSCAEGEYEIENWRVGTKKVPPVLRVQAACWIPGLLQDIERNSINRSNRLYARAVGLELACPSLLTTASAIRLRAELRLEMKRMPN